ncbi:MAG: MFS transporter [Candidatus Sulfotelmatobacter sp.]
MSKVSQNPKELPSLWRPLRERTFRNLLLADIASDIGTFMQSVGAAWMMVSLNAGPLYVALTQTASALPFFILALPAGAIGDIVDRRKLILFTETWMAAVAILLATLTLEGRLSPVLLLVLTFALSAGDAIESPTWRAVLPELVSKEDLAAAAALNGIEFNFARAIGPALAGFVIAVANVGTAFLVNAASFLGVILVIARWKRPRHKRTTPPETLNGAMVAALRYVRYSPAIRALIFRSGILMFFASGLLALLPSVAHQVSHSPMGYGLLLGCFGLGAVLGAVVMQRVRARWSAEAVVSGAVLIFGLTTMATGSFRALPMLGAVMLVGGAAWIVFISLFNVLILNHTPDWVRARVLAVSMLVFQGAMAAGSAAWGALAAKTGIPTALMWAGLGTIVSTVTGLFLKLPDTTVDLTPWIHWRLPTILNHDSAPEDAGPIVVTIEYYVDAENAPAFIKAINRYGRIRRRDGAYRWGIFRDLENPERYQETFLVDSWAEHLRQHERSTRADRLVTERVQKYVRGEPIVRHLVYATEDSLAQAGVENRRKAG